MTMSRADLCSLDAISLSFHKEMAKEKEPKGLIPFGIPQDLFLGWSFGGYQKGVVASARFAQQNPKILLLLQAGEDISLRPSVALYARQKRESELLP